MEAGFALTYTLTHTDTDTFKRKWRHVKAQPTRPDVTTLALLWLGKTEGVKRVRTSILNVEELRGRLMCTDPL